MKSFYLQEYNKRETAEAKIVKDLDRFEMILQAYEYEKGILSQISMFFDTQRDCICHEV